MSGKSNKLQVRRKSATENCEKSDLKDKNFHTEIKLHKNLAWKRKKKIVKITLRGR